MVDPKSRDLTRYRGATVVTPNLRETEAAAREPIHNSAELAQRRRASSAGHRSLRFADYAW